MEKFLETREKVCELNTKLNEECKEYLKRVLATQPNNRIELNNEEYETVCVTYDGGRHPEYDTNPYSQVYSVFLNEKGNICVETEDSEEYESYRFDVDELADVCELVLAILE